MSVVIINKKIHIVNKTNHMIAWDPFDPWTVASASTLAVWALVITIEKLR